MWVRSFWLFKSNPDRQCSVKDCERIEKDTG